LIGGCYTNE